MDKGQVLLVPIITSLWHISQKLNKDFPYQISQQVKEPLNQILQKRNISYRKIQEMIRWFNKGKQSF